MVGIGHTTLLPNASSQTAVAPDLRLTKDIVPDDTSSTVVSAFDPRSDLPGALGGWRTVLGHAYVLADDKTLDHCARSECGRACGRWSN
jgi:hypothetical protein